ncbi:type III-B CRISPR module RAMP protein Cmr1 [Paenibacillus popilliae]|uniref:type III-B CRISPR module RAMP protein Cmr1 n=1 Tax=Paenibacillus popilliae TaxID=78057 RepID=UPI0005A6ACC2
MNKCTLNCTIISPMFSLGNQRAEAELRPSALKGLMRYIFRIASIEPDTKALYRLESEYFGDAEKNASPVRLQFKSPSVPVGGETCQQLMLHRKTVAHKDSCSCFPHDTTFQLMIRTGDDTDIEEYKEWIALSLIPIMQSEIHSSHLSRGENIECRIVFVHDWAGKIIY